MKKNTIPKKVLTFRVTEQERDAFLNEAKQKSLTIQEYLLKKLMQSTTLLCVNETVYRKYKKLLNDIELEIERIRDSDIIHRTFRFLNGQRGG